MKKLIFILLFFLSFKTIGFAGWPLAVPTGSAKDDFNSARTAFAIEHSTTDGIHESVRVRNSFQVGGVSTSTYNLYVSSYSLVLPVTNISGAGSGSGLNADTLDSHDSTYFQVNLTTPSWKAYDSDRWDGVDSTNTFLSATKSDSTAFQLDIASVNITTALMGIGSKAGDLMYYNGTKWVALSSGTAGQYLETGTVPIWNTPAGAGDCTKADDEVITGDWHFNNNQTTFTAIVVEGDANFSDSDSTVTVAGTLDGDYPHMLDRAYNADVDSTSPPTSYTVFYSTDAGVPDGAKAVIIHIYNLHTATRSIYFRKKGATNSSMFKTASGNTYLIEQFSCPIDDNEQLEWYSDTAPVTVCRWAIIGYFK